MPSPNTFRNAALVPGSPLGSVDKSVNLTADAQFVGTEGVSLIRISSNDTTPSNRTFTIQSGPNPTMAPGGSNMLIFNFASAGNTSCLLANSGNMRLISDWTPTLGQSLTLMWDGSFWNELARTGAGSLETSGSLTQSQIQGMNATPVTLLATARPNQAYIIDSIEYFHSFSTLAYAGGGDVAVQYDTGATVIALADVALVTGGANLRTYAVPTIYNLDASTGTATGFNLANAAGKSVTITNASAAFTAGNAANVLKYKLKYRLLTVLP